MPGLLTWLSLFFGVSICREISIFDHRSIPQPKSSQHHSFGDWQSLDQNLIGHKRKANTALVLLSLVTAPCIRKSWTKVSFPHFGQIICRDLPNRARKSLGDIFSDLDSISGAPGQSKTRSAPSPISSSPSQFVIPIPKISPQAIKEFTRVCRKSPPYVIPISTDRLHKLFQFCKIPFIRDFSGVFNNEHPI